MDGVLNIDKPAGLTSHDVVAGVRRLTGQARVGHAGTLDPAATGVLLVGLGKGTKLTPFLHEYPKTYRAVLQLGIRTDTYDATGHVVETRAVGPLSRAEVQAVLGGFRGRIAQIPPMYSALKRQGRRLYRLARDGVEVERQPRQVEIFRLDLIALAATRLTLEVQCSGGTYIRTLAEDIGARLGCGAHLAELVRLAVGPFRLAEAMAWPSFEAAARQGTWSRHLVSLAEAMAAFPALVVTARAALAVARGKPPAAREVVRIIGQFEAGGTVAVLGPERTLLAMGAATAGAAELRRCPPETPAIALRRVLADEQRVPAARRDDGETSPDGG
jgi:tRNA pseudouridine55 synthase